jgi:glutamine synthetase
MGVLNTKWQGDRKPSRPARSSWLGVWVQRARSGAPRNATAVIPKFPREHILHLARFRAGFGDHFVDYYVHIKDAEIARYREEVIGGSDQADVTEWEHREYFDAF